MDLDDSESAPMDLDTTATEQDLVLDGSPASMTPPTAPDLDAKTKTFWSPTSDRPPTLTKT